MDELLQDIDELFSARTARRKASEQGTGRYACPVRSIRASRRISSTLLHRTRTRPSGIASDGSKRSWRCSFSGERLIFIPGAQQYRGYIRDTACTSPASACSRCTRRYRLREPLLGAAA